jgi:uncharacterized protein with ParB-like and HNH nuclease domain
LFQRQYDWKTENRQQLWSDVLAVHEDRQQSKDAQHFMGSVVTAPEQLGPNRPATHTLIDGQQRLTTLLLILAALRDHIAETDTQASTRIDGLYLRNQFPQEPSDEFKILPTQRDRDEFAALMHCEPGTETAPGLRQAYRYFRQRLRSERDSDGKPIDVLQLEGTLLQGLSVVSITLGSNDNPYRVFESLNATGLELRQIDLIRNLFMMELGIEQAEQAYAKLWLPMETLLAEHFEAFAHDYYLKDGTFMRANDTYINARSRMENFRTTQVVEALEDMAWFANRWACIYRPSRESHKGIRASLSSLKRFGADTPYPFILNLFAARDRDSALTSDEFAQIVTMLEGFLIRRMFANVPTNQLNRMFIRLWAQLPHVNNTVLEVREALSEPSRRWPNDNAFRNDFISYPLYIDSQPQQRRLILDRLERSYGHKEIVALGELQIEHIMPQTLTEDWRSLLGSNAEAIHTRWLHTAGNLTLTAYNPELSNASWPDKKEFYAASNVSMTRALANIVAFDADALINRGRELARRAIRLWPGPSST